MNTLPGVRKSHIRVLVTAPAKHNTQYLYASLACIELWTVADFGVWIYHAPPATDCAIVHISRIEPMGQGLAPSLTFHAKADMALRETSSVAARYLQVLILYACAVLVSLPSSSDCSRKRPLDDAPTRVYVHGRRSMGSSKRECLRVKGVVAPSFTAGPSCIH
jgi:hypothetical protein